MDLNRIPRWALVALALLGMSAMGTMINQARADMSTVKAVAYEARNKASAQGEDILEIKNEINKIQTTQEVFRKEYREDQKDMQKALADIAKAVKA